MSILLRIRTQLGTWRLQNVKKTDTLEYIRLRVEREHNTDLQGRPFSTDIKGKFTLVDELTIESAGLSHGDMLYVMVDESKTTVHELASSSSKRITKDGSIIQQEYSHLSSKNGFRPGMMSLRSMKMAWTLNEFVALDQQFEFKIKRQTEPSICTKATINKSVIEDFQGYMLHYDYRKIRFGFLYGSINNDNSVKIEVIYEPPQDTNDVTFTLLDDPNANNVEILTGLLNLKKVGWIIAHPTREKGFNFSNAEILATAEHQLEAAGGVNDTTFVTVKVTMNDQGEMISEAYQVSKQCMEMVAEGAIQTSPNLGMCSVNPTFTALVEGKPTTEIDNDFFLVPLPITTFESEVFVSLFPKTNRDNIIPSSKDLQKQLNKVGKEGWNLQALISDFHLLLYLSNFFSISEDIPILCQSVLDKSIPINEGYSLILNSLAGMD